MQIKEALEIVRTRCSKSGTCENCPYKLDFSCEPRVTLLMRPEPKKKKKWKLNK